MGKLFGTDGIRGVANEYPMTVDMALKVGRATAKFFKKKSRIVVGKDTRISGDMIASAVMAGVCSQGVDALYAGIMPTPGVSHLTIRNGADAGIVISASHNPYYDNGIKLFKSDGYKLSDEAERSIESLILDPTVEPLRLEGGTGRIIEPEDPSAEYSSFLRSCLVSGTSLGGMKIAMDCSNGATYSVAPELFRKLGADIYPICTSPDGKNINDNCGSQHLQRLSETVEKIGADVGFAFDGDGDRLVAIDETGNRVSGDKILLICGKHLKQRDVLKNNRVVSTVMSNFGLGVALKNLGIDHRIADVGDRYVLKEMLSSGSVLGGEDSGHLIFLDHHPTGDGMLAALKLIEAMLFFDKPLSELNGLMQVFPQVLLNVDVSKKPDIDSIPAIVSAVKHVEKKLGESGRVLIRYSGTQPLCRVMVEGQDEEDTHEYCEELAEVIFKSIG